MKIAALALVALLVGSPREAPVAPPPEVDDDAGPPFGHTLRTYRDASTCSGELASLVRASMPPAYAAAVGPYRIAAGDHRAHRVRARDWGHEIEEFRCLGAALSSRRWTHAMMDVKPFTIEDIGRMSFPAE
ncbi:MAG TPA: hypothetical protein VEZ48_10600 [Sphingomonadaceae bacterium]|nr:hypothetical protein [Sphingomonadaceae bacterium]